MKVCIVIPAHNEKDRIGHTLRAYVAYFKNTAYSVDFLVVLNGCIDNTLSVVQEIQKESPSISYLNYYTT